MNHLAVFALGVLLIVPGHSALAQMAGYYPKGGPDIEADDVSLIRLIGDPKAYDHKIVRVVGFLHLEFEGNAIYLHGEDFRYGLTKNGLWIDLPRDVTQEQKAVVNDQYVICTARFVAGAHGHMGLSSGELTDVTRLEVWRSLPRPTRK